MGDVIVCVGVFLATNIRYFFKPGTTCSQMGQPNAIYGKCRQLLQIHAVGDAHAPNKQRKAFKNRYSRQNHHF
jgi:hypothetical protein